MIKRHVHRVYHLARPHAGQFGRYLVSGGMAFVVDYGSYLLLLHFLQPWYVIPSMVSGTLGFFSAFVFHKFLVFKKQKETLRHFLRYCAMQFMNVLAQSAILYALVEWFSVDPKIGKIIAIACCVAWNFFLYKFFVYV